MGEKAPAFQFYAADWLADITVRTLSLAQRGAYIDLLAYCWREEFIPSDPSLLANLVGADPTEFRESIWPGLSTCFKPVPGSPQLLYNRRIEREREKQQRYREAKSRAGKKGAQAKWGKRVNGSAMNLPMAKNSPSSSSSKDEDRDGALGKRAVPSSPYEGVTLTPEEHERWMKKHGGASRPREANDR